MSEAATRAAASRDSAAGLLLPPTACVALCVELPRAADLHAALAVIEQVRHLILGEGLLTVNVNSTIELVGGEAFELRRLWSSKPAAYPVAGRKRKTTTPWARQLLQRGEVFVGEGDIALAEVFDDHEKIMSLDLHSVINMPLLADGRCVATFNVLGPRHQWKAHEVMLVRLLALLVTPWVLRAVARKGNPQGQTAG